MSVKIGQREKEFLAFIQEAGLIWGPSPEIYGGVAGFFTYGPLGKLLKNKVEQSVRRVFNANGLREIEGPTVLPDVVWKASGHLGTFTDPVVFTKDKKDCFRVDKLLEEEGVEVDDFSDENLLKLIEKHKIKSPNGKELEKEIIHQSLMMKTNVMGKDASLRPETATGTYLPFPRFLNYFRRKIPFSVFQIGKAYRNEISPRQHLLRGREFTQAEGQIFVDPKEKNNWKKFDEIKKDIVPLLGVSAQKKKGKVVLVKMEEAVKKKMFKSKAYAWCVWLAYMQFVDMGIPRERIRLRQHMEEEKAFYADDAWDVEVNLHGFGWYEMCGVHDRTDYDLKQHSKESGIKLEVRRENGERFVPHILEIAFGIDRPVYALIDLFYEKKGKDEGKTVFSVPYHMAPIDVGVYPLIKKDDLVDLAQDVVEELERDFIVEYDESGSIGRRYLRGAMMGVPFAVTIDFDSLKDETVTVRSRNSEKQIRVGLRDLRRTLRKLINGEINFLSAGKEVKNHDK